MQAAYAAWQQAGQALHLPPRPLSSALWWFTAFNESNPAACRARSTLPEGLARRPWLEGDVWAWRGPRSDSKIPEARVSGAAVSSDQ